MPQLLDKSTLASGRNRVKSWAYVCSRNTLAFINTMFVFIGLILISVAAYGKQESMLVSVPALGGVIACGVFLILVAILGLVGAIKHNQVILFFYMIIMSLLFILLLVFSIAALAITQGQQHELIKKAWVHIEDDQKVHIEKAFNCCGLDKDDKRSTCDVKLGPCYESVREPLDQALSVCGGVGLAISFTLLMAVYCTVRYRNQKDPRLEADAYIN